MAVSEVDPDELHKANATTPSAPEDGRNDIQRSFDETTTTSPTEPLLETGIKSVIHGVGSPFIHPVDTVKGLGNTLLQAPNRYCFEHDPWCEIRYLGWWNPSTPLQRQREISSVAWLLVVVPRLYLELEAKWQDMLPSRARAGQTFESLNRDLAEQPVTLKHTVAPLQRVTEIGERGSSLPTPVTKLLQRSQAIEPMTFPEARDSPKQPE